MRRFLRNLLHPDRYHGRLRGQKPPFFEGWYFKCVDKTEQHRFAFIPGVFWGERPHAFVQVLDGARTLVHYHEYPVDAFWAAEDRFEVAVGDNRFHQDGLTLAVDNAAQRVAGQLQFEGPVGWPVTFASPGIMGWYAWVPFMECYHGVVSLDHALHGSLHIDGREIDEALQLREVGPDQEHAVLQRSLLECNQMVERGTIVRIAAQAVHGLRGAGHDPTAFQCGSRLLDLRVKLRAHRPGR